MPITLSKFSSPRGIPMVRSVSTGHLVAADMDGLVRSIAPGAEGGGLPYLALTEKSTTYSPEARGFFTKNTINLSAPAIAVVVPSLGLRVVVSFMVRVASQLSSKIAATPIRLFAEEAEAVAWLEDQVASQHESESSGRMA
jgi:hypothetical protein